MPTKGERRTGEEQQLWRLPLSLLLHYGLIDCALVVVLQCYLGIELEKVIGAVRLGVVYTVTGLGGLLLGSTIRPYEPNVGGLGAVCGLLGVRYVELIQTRPLIRDAWRMQMLQTALFNTVLILLGALPPVSVTYMKAADTDAVCID